MIHEWSSKQDCEERKCLSVKDQSSPNEVKMLLLNSTLIHHSHINTHTAFIRLYMSGCASRYLMCDFIVFKSHPLWLLSNWKPDGKHLVSPSGGRGVYASVCDSVYACACQRQTNNGSYTRRADVCVWPPWSCLCPPFIKIIDKEHRGAHLLPCGSVIGLILRPLNHTLSIYFPKSVSA